MYSSLTNNNSNVHYNSFKLLNTVESLLFNNLQCEKKIMEYFLFI